MQRTYFLSDPHFFGKNVIRHSGRRWAMNPQELEEWDRTGSLGSVSAESGIAMNQYIVDKVNRKVLPDDRLVFVGDVVFSNGLNQGIVRTLDILDRIECKDVHIVWGNHDCDLPSIGSAEGKRSCPQEREDYESAIGRLYRSCGHSRMVYCEQGIQVWCSHYPCVTWPRASKTGQPGISNPGSVQSIHAYGHVHDRYNDYCPLARPDLWAACNVGVDTLHDWPLSAGEMYSLLERQRTGMIREINQNKHYR